MRLREDGDNAVEVGRATKGARAVRGGVKSSSGRNMLMSKGGGIIQFIEEVIGDRSLSPAQKVIHKAVYGEPLAPEELELFKLMTGLECYRPREWSELTVIAGRGGGKSNQLASNMSIFEATARQHRLAVGEIAQVLIISTEQKRQSRIMFNYILKKMEGSPILRAMIESTTSDEVRLRNNCLISVYPCNLARVRGASIAMCICDEVGFWKSEGHSIDREVMEAVRPGLRLPHSKLIKISSPYWMRGELYQDWKRFHGKKNEDCLVFQAETKMLNPTFSDKKLEAARKRDPVAYATEYGAQFRTDLSAMYDPAVIDQAVDPDRPLELPPRADAGAYHAFVDVSGGGGKDSYSIALGHLEGERTVVDVVRSRAPKFNPQEVTAQYAELLKDYGVGRVVGDKYSGDWALNAFAKCGITYERAEKTKSELYLEAEGAFNTGRVSLPGREALLAQLKALVRKTRSGGKDSVDTDAGQPEDEANVVAGLIDMLLARQSSIGCEWNPPGEFCDEEEERPKPWSSGRLTREIRRKLRDLS